MKKVLVIVFIIIIMLTGCWPNFQRAIKEMKETSLEESKEFFIANKDKFEKVHNALIEIDESYTIIERYDELVISTRDGQKPIDAVFEDSVVEAVKSLFYTQSGKSMVMIGSMASFVIEVDNLIDLIIRNVDDVETLNQYSVQTEPYIEHLEDNWYVVVYCRPAV